MRTFHFTIPNTDSWRITDTEVIVVAENKLKAKELLTKAGYHLNDGTLKELKTGVHLIQDYITE